MLSEGLICYIVGIQFVAPVFVKLESGSAQIFVCFIGVDQFSDSIKLTEKQRDFVGQIYEHIMNLWRLRVMSNDDRGFRMIGAVCDFVWNKVPGIKCPQKVIDTRRVLFGFGVNVDFVA